MKNIHINGTIHCLDLAFLNISGAIASYLIPHSNGAVLIETGPTSTFSNLITKLSSLGYDITDITDVFLTHIHLDHCGAAGILAENGARIHVHPNGAPHLSDPTKLISSATRLYGEAMDTLWGRFIPVDPAHLFVHEDYEIINIEDVQIQVIETPGHAKHHYSYVFNHTCFTGDIGGVRLEGCPHLVLPTPPPELDIEKWRKSLIKIKNLDITQIAPTHFGIYNDPKHHIDLIFCFLDEIENWMEEIMPVHNELENVYNLYSNWIRERMIDKGIGKELWTKYEMVNPSWMSAAGLLRYWNHLSQK